jgi:hypothetical protein
MLLFVQPRAYLLQYNAYESGLHWKGHQQQSFHLNHKMYIPDHNLKNKFVTEMQLEATKWNLLWLDKSENLSFSRVFNHIAIVSVITRKKHIWLRKLLNLCSTSMSFQKFWLFRNRGN